MTTKPLGANPGFVFQDGGQQAGDVWVTELIRITNTKAAAQADSTAATVADQVIEFNALLAKLRTAGLMEE